MSDLTDAQEQDRLHSTSGQGVNVSSDNSAEAAAAVDQNSPAPGTTAPDASAHSDNNSEDDLRSADEAGDSEDKHYPNPKPADTEDTQDSQDSAEETE